MVKKFNWNNIEPEDFLSNARTEFVSYMVIFFLMAMEWYNWIWLVLGIRMMNMIFIERSHIKWKKKI